MPPKKDKIMSEIRICKYCSVEFVPKRDTQLFCCARCRSRYNATKYKQAKGRDIVKKKCIKCGKTFITSELKREICLDCVAAKRKEKKISNKEKIVSINKLARESGMSYGKFVAQTSMKPLERK